MCGIIGYIGAQNPKGILLDGLKRLEYRGYDSAGIAILEPKETKVFRSEGRIQSLEKKLTDAKFQGTVGIGHTRWATHGAPTEENAHPHRAGAVTLVHNGIIENYMEHRQSLEAAGRKFLSETDSEIVAHLFDVEIQKGKSLQEAVQGVLPHLEGSYAFVALSEKEPDKIVGVRNGVPLLIGTGKGENFFASDVQAILHRTNQIIYLKDRQIAICSREGVSIVDAAGKSVAPEVKTLQWSADQTDKAGYRHYMLKEIHEQPQAIAQTIESYIDQRQGLITLPTLNISTDQMKKLRRISIVACGTARHAGLVAQYYLERLAKIPVSVDYGSEFRYRNPILEQDTLLILISQSGETADTLAGLAEGKEKKIPSLAICNVRESSLTREADNVIYTNAGPEIGVASTKAFTTQLAVLYMLAVRLGHVRGNISDAYARELTQDLLRLPILIARTLELDEKLEALALEHLNFPFFFYMGRDAQFPIALEGALKLKEISYAHAEGYAAGELKHGPIALIDRNTAVLILAPSDQPSKNGPDLFNRNSDLLREKMMSNLMEVKSRGGKILSFANETDGDFSKQSHHTIGIPKTSWALSPILMTVPLQLFSYYMALHRGTDVDKPRNLAKSVTVE